MDPANDLYSLFRLEGYDSNGSGWSQAFPEEPRFTGGTVTLPTGTSYWWEITVDLYDLGIYSDPEGWGSSFMFRLFLKDASGTFQPIPGLTVDYRECLRMLQEDGAAYCPYTYA